MNKRVNTIEPCVEDARALIDELKSRLNTDRHRHLVHIFTALAKDDKAVGLLAYYLWCRRSRYYRRTSRQYSQGQSACQAL